MLRVSSKTVDSIKGLEHCAELNLHRWKVFSEWRLNGFSFPHSLRTLLFHPSFPGSIALRWSISRQGKFEKSFRLTSPTFSPIIIVLCKPRVSGSKNVPSTETHGYIHMFEYNVHSPCVSYLALSMNAV